MRHLILALGLLIPFVSLAQDEVKVSEYSYTELFRMIEEEEDSVFRLENANIYFEPKTDSIFLTKVDMTSFSLLANSRDSIIVSPKIVLDKVSFQNLYKGDYLLSLSKIVFEKEVVINSPNHLAITNCSFKNKFEIIQRDNANQTEFDNLWIWNNSFSGDVTITARHSDAEQLMQIWLKRNVINNEVTTIWTNASGDFVLHDNHIKASRVYLSGNNDTGPTDNIELLNNVVAAQDIDLVLNTKNIEYIKISKNRFEGWITLSIDDLSASSSIIEWNQFSNKIIDNETLNYWKHDLFGLFEHDEYETKSLNNSQTAIEDLDYYVSSARIQDQMVYNSEIALRGKFYDYFNSRHENEAANQIYREMKDLETERMAYLYQTQPTFKTFFKWHINQFLKEFSAYGTEPERAIIFSMYVILAFALVYLFFPNYWDSHGKDRILHRYRFFLKYLNKDAGMHDVYLEDKKDELAHYEGFRNFFIENGKTVPKFFLATALPLYRWSTASTRGSSWLLERIDIFKGRWSELPAPQRAIKTILLGIVFMAAILYDIFIKILNALMLSINTFTTLGFGEIPIKGLPRYLAIIQGFIGWFMLTIFSVSLISQLLN
ncbi:ion channel [Roseivirga sp.]|uniref:ion channel n=1 Tax=Roseivirga sp. TaxID=1964215 RepID=UPI003B8CD7FA